MYLCKFWFRWFWASSRLGMAIIHHYWHRERDDSIMYLLLYVFCLFVCVCVYQGYGSVCGIDDVDLGPPMSMSGAQICHSPCHPVYFFSLALCCLILCALRDDMHIMLIWFWKPKDWSFLSSAFWQLPFGRIMKTTPQQILLVLRSSTTMMGGQQILDKFQISVFTTQCCSQQTLILV